METTLDTAAQAHWQAVHTNYLMAHQHYLQAKLAQDGAGETTPMRVAKNQLYDAQQALSDFFLQHTGR